MTKTWLDYIKEEQFSEDYRLIARAIGLENTIKLAQALPSVYIYLASPDKLFKPAKVEYVRDRYAQACPEEPFNHRHIALETGLSIREVYDIVAARKEEPKQPQLFDGA
jgi:hypothetical protein